MFTDRTVSVETLTSLESLLLGRRLIVDVACGNNVSSNIKKEDLYLMWDPRNTSIDMGKNNKANGGLIYRIQSGVEDLPEFLKDTAFRVQIIAPDPRNVFELVKHSSELVMPGGGKIVVVSDTTSNLAHLVDPSYEQIRDYYDYKGSEFEVHKPIRLAPGIADQYVQGHINTELIPGESKVLVLIRK